MSDINQAEHVHLLEIRASVEEEATSLTKEPKSAMDQEQKKLIYR